MHRENSVVSVSSVVKKLSFSGLLRHDVPRNDDLKKVHKIPVIIHENTAFRLALML